MIEPKKLIQNIGLNKKETDIYLALLELGPSTPAQVAKRADIKRPTSYVLLEGLAEKGFVSRISGRPKKFKAEHPDKLKFRLRENLAIFEKSLPWLMSLVNSNKEMPNVQFFYGLEDIKKAYMESLLLLPGSELLAFGSAGAVLQKLEGFIEVYLNERVSRHIRVRAITPIGNQTEKMILRDKQELRETRLLDSGQFNKDVEIDIYSDKILIVSLEGEKSVAIVLESKTISDALRQMFEIVWGVARPVRGLKK